MSWSPLFQALLRNKLASSKGRLRSPTKQINYPDTLERKYFSMLARLVRSFMVPVKQMVEKNYPEWTRTLPPLRKDADDLHSLNSLMLDLQKEILSTPDNATRRGTLAAIQSFGEEIEGFNAKQMGEFIKMAIGEAFHPEEPWIAQNVRAWAQNNYTLIKTLTDKTIARVNEQVTTAVREGRPWIEVRDMIERTQEVSTNHAKLIARDQIGKLNGELTKARNKEAGISLYIWRTSRDERVRGYAGPGAKYPDAIPSHWAMEGKLCRWDDATLMSEDGGKTWVQRPYLAPVVHPGEAIQCRCVSTPYLGDLIAEGRAFLESGLSLEEYAGQ